MTIFDGGAAEMADAQAVARQLAGVEPLTAAAQAIADLDGDGRVTATDLLLLLRLLAPASLSTPVAPPRLSSLAPAVAAPGTSITVVGETLARTGEQTLVVLGAPDGAVVIAPASATGDMVVFDAIPADPESLERTYMVQVVRQGVPSNALHLILALGPALESIDPDAAVEGATVALQVLPVPVAGPDIEVHFTGAASVSGTIDQERITAVVPQGLASSVDVSVRVGDRWSNTMPFRRLVPSQGTVVLPAGSSSDVMQLRVVCSDGQTAQPDASGRFDVALPEVGLLEAQLHDAAGRVVGGAFLRQGLPMVIDTRSSAALWACLASNAVALRTDQFMLVHALVRDHESIAALGDALAVRHASEPRLFTGQAGDPVAVALSAAIRFAGSVIDTILATG